jgi:hypothetical protein
MNHSDAEVGFTPRSPNNVITKPKIRSPPASAANSRVRPKRDRENGANRNNEQGYELLGKHLRSAESAERSANENASELAVDAIDTLDLSD